jgi:hypothetical protein
VFLLGRRVSKSDASSAGLHGLIVCSLSTGARLGFPPPQILSVSFLSPVWFNPANRVCQPNFSCSKIPGGAAVLHVFRWIYFKPRLLRSMAKDVFLADRLVSPVLLLSYRIKKLEVS